MCSSHCTVETHAVTTFLRTSITIEIVNHRTFFLTYLYLSKDIYSFVLLLLSLSLYLFNCLWLSIFPTPSLSLSITLSLSIYLSIYPSIHPSIHPSISASTYKSTICISIDLFLSIAIFPHCPIKQLQIVFHAVRRSAI